MFFVVLILCLPVQNVYSISYPEVVHQSKGNYKNFILLHYLPMTPVQTVSVYTGAPPELMKVTQ